MSTLLHVILDRAPALATLAQECKGCHGTLCKGCHGTEHGGGCPYATAVPTQPWFAITSVHAEKAWLLSQARGALCKTFRPRRCAAAMAASLGLSLGCCRLERRASRLARPRPR